MGRVSVCSLAGLMILSCLLVSLPRGEASIQCPAVLRYLMPCASYLRSNGGGGAGRVPPGACCDGIHGLSAAAVVAKDKRDACNCIEKFAGQATGLNFALVGSLPATCGIALSFVPSPSINCNSLV